MKRILYSATSDVHIKTFHIPYIKWLQAQGYEVHLAVEKRGDVDLSFCDEVFYVPFKRSPFDIENLKALRAVKSIIKSNGYALIHCHTPMASVITRLAAMGERKNGCKIIYTSHGFHFSSEAPAKNWLLYYPVEKLLAKVTDAIITINTEDYLIAKNKLKVKDVYQLNSIGVDTEKFSAIDQWSKTEIREKHGVNKDDFILFYAADFIPRKHHAFFIKCMKVLKKEIPGVKLYLAGTGLLFEKIKKEAYDEGVHEVVYFLGWRNDINELAAIADVGVSSSKLEGLGLGLAETMYCNVPIVASNTKGHRELIEHGKNGYIYEQNNVEAFCSFIVYLYQNKDVRHQMGKACKTKIKDFTIDKSLNKMKQVYQKYLT
jgi:glycosyltransferase EpsD